MCCYSSTPTRLPEGADSLLTKASADARWKWGRFDVVIEGAHPLLRVVAWFMNRRSRLTGIATGDQALFVRREAFAEVGGFLFEVMRVEHNT